MVFPRLAAVAEIGWSAAPTDSAAIETARDFDDFASGDPLTATTKSRRPVRIAGSLFDAE